MYTTRLSTLFLSLDYYLYADDIQLSVSFHPLNFVSGDTLQYKFEESVFHRRTQHMTQLFTYLLTQNLFRSCIRRYLVSRACD